jgi:hypothetical protein
VRIELASAVTRSWVRLYTRRLAADIRASRIAEIESDLWEHRRETAEAGAEPSDAGLQILARCLVGIPADLTWRSGAARQARVSWRREPMNDVIRRSWWLVPAVLVGVFDVILFLGQLTDFFGLIGFEPRVGIRLAASAAWLLAAVCIAVGIALRNRRPQRAGSLVIVGSLPAVLSAWMMVPPLLGIAAIVGAIHHMTTAPSPAHAPA